MSESREPSPRSTRRPRGLVLVIDDEAKVRKSIADFARDLGHRVLEAESGEKGLEIADAEDLDLVLLDLSMPGLDGIGVLGKLGARTRTLPVVMISGAGTFAKVVEAVKLGAYDFLEKPPDPEKLTLTIERALEMRRLRLQNEELLARVSADDELLGDSAPMVALRREIEKVAPTPAKVLIFGENGSGKELVARAIHRISPRSGGPFVKLNSAAIPKDLVESELFGYEKGAFTGAATAKRGKLEVADDGTLFLDEIGDMSLEAQAKLLRAIESGEVERIGGTSVIHFDTRIVAATNKDIRKEIEAGRFREDLFHRLNVVPITVPPLRERGGDIVTLARHYIARYANEYDREPRILTKEALGLLSHYPWPGNVRELRNLAERLVIMGDAAEVTAAEITKLLPEESPGAPDTSLRAQRESSEREVIQKELERAGWNVTLASKSLGIDRAHLHRKMKRLGIERPGGASKDE